MSRGHYRLFALVVTPAAAGGHPRREAEASSNVDSTYYPPNTLATPLGGRSATPSNCEEPVNHNRLPEFLIEVVTPRLPTPPTGSPSLYRSSSTVVS